MVVRQGGAGAQVKTRVRPIRTGSIAISPGYVFRTEARSLPQAVGVGVPKGARVIAPIGAFLVEHPTAGPVLIDTGMHPVTEAQPARNLGRIMGAVFKGLRIGPGENVPAQLRAWGLSPQDVRTVVMTHLHPDHTSAMSEFRGASFVCTRAEWEAARRPLGALRGYLREHLPPESSMRFVDFDGAEPWEGLDRTIDLLGDGTIRLVWTPGHTVGHLSVLVEAEERPVFLLGDAVYTLRNLREDILPWRTASDEDSRATMRQLRAYAEAHPEVPLVPTHDAAVWDELAPVAS
jgi:N-acyl homoserine lactone hydrolase